MSFLSKYTLPRRPFTDFILTLPPDRSGVHSGSGSVCVQELLLEELKSEDLRGQEVYDCEKCLISRSGSSSSSSSSSSNSSSSSSSRRSSRHDSRVNVPRQPASRSTCVKEAPDHLVIMLSRFQALSHGGRVSKIRTPVAFSERLILPVEFGGGIEYSPYGVIVHHGRSLLAGHYTALVSDSDLSTDGSAGWVHCDDGNVKRGPLGRCCRPWGK